MKTTVTRWGLRMGLLGALLAALLVLVACGVEPEPTDDDVGAAVRSTLPYQMAVVRTSTPRPSPTPVVPPSPLPSATPVQELGPTPTAEAKELTTDDIARISVADAKAQADAGQALLLDTRDVGSFGQLHIAGAISMPAGEVAKRIGELPPDKLLIFYCA